MGQDGEVAAVVEEEVDYNSDIRPILSENCFHYHGSEPENRQSDLRLDQFASASGDRGGYRAIEPGNAEASEMLVRMLDDDPDVQMPPPDFRVVPPAADIDINVYAWSGSFKRGSTIR